MDKEKYKKICQMADDILDKIACIERLTKFIAELKARKEEIAYVTITPCYYHISQPGIEVYGVSLESLIPVLEPLLALRKAELERLKEELEAL